MTCDLWRSKLDAYVDSELANDELAKLEAHLRACSSCAADALGRLQMKRMTQAVGLRYAPEPEFRLRLEQSIRAHGKPRDWFAWIRSGSSQPGGRRLAALLLAAAVVVLMIGSADLWLRHWLREQALAEIADLHVATLASATPVDVISSDRHTVKPWFAGKLPFSFNMPELKNSPFTLVGGRLTYFEHSPGAQLLFEVGKHRLSVFIFQDQSTSNLSAVAGNSRELAFHLEMWAEGGLRYIVISDAAQSDVHNLAELLRAAARS
jgi:anti-sigma factor RsiW